MEETTRADDPVPGAGGQPQPTATLPRPPRAIPPRVVDAVLIAVLALLYLGFLASQVFLHGSAGHRTIGPPQWSGRTILGAMCFPVVFALWWRRSHPIRVLAVTLGATAVAYPFPSLTAIVALFSAAVAVEMRPTRALVSRPSLALWGAGSAAFLMGRLLAGGAAVLADLTSSLFTAGAATGVGMYVGARRSYVERLRERALFARALAAFLPPQVARRIEASPSSLELREEVVASIVFSDIRGFSTIAEQLPAREVAELVGRHVSAMAEVVTAHGGTLDKFAGDAVMAVFGVPEPLEDHADRAIRCAIAMQGRQRELNDEATDLGLPRAEIGVGINSGPVIAGTLGGMGRLDYTVLGDAVNVAQRLQSEAAAGQILASAETIRLAGAAPTEALGSRRLKGRQGPVDVFLIATDPVPRSRS